MTVGIAAGTEGAEPVEADGADGRGWKVRPVKHVNAIAGNSFVLSAYGSNFGSMFIILHDFADRPDPKLYAARVAKNLRRPVRHQGRPRPPR